VPCFVGPGSRSGSADHAAFVAFAAASLLADRILTAAR
jgi:hypothetical protein